MIETESSFTEANDLESLSIPRNKSTKRIFIAATRMNDGKTTSSLGLYSALNDSQKKLATLSPWDSAL